MSTSNPETVEFGDEPTDTRSRVAAFIRQRAKDGSLSLLTGTLLFVRARQMRENPGRAVVGVITATGLVGIGLYQRRSRRNTAQADDDRDGQYEKTGTYEERADSHQPDTNPRGTSEEPDVETKTEPDEGPIQFTEDQKDEVQPSPSLDSQSSEDPRPHDEEETTEIDLSEAAMADEASEAVGPSSEQSQPTQIDDAEPEEPVEEEESQQSDPDDESDEKDEESERSE